MIRTGDFIDHKKAPCFLEMTDAISLNYDRIRMRGGFSFDFRVVVFKLESLRLKAYEQRIVNDFDASFIVSEVDRQYLFGPHPDMLSRVVVCPNGVDLEKFPFCFSPEGRDIIFIGNMTSLQNLDAARYMAVEILPLVRSRCPGSRLRLVGRIQPKKAQELSRIPGVVVTGEVPDVAMAVKGGAVGVCPLRLGAGIQNKILEYMALGLPTITTSMGLEGLSAEPDRDLIVADDSEVFANAIATLILDRNEAEMLAVNGRHYVQSSHSWEVLLEPLVSKIAKKVIGV
jgi:glycosyltransferase involved in cell wall biosynthesis